MMQKCTQSRRAQVFNKQQWLSDSGEVAKSVTEYDFHRHPYKWHQNSIWPKLLQCSGEVQTMS